MKVCELFYWSVFRVWGYKCPHILSNPLEGSKEHSDSKNKYTEDDIINMLEFLVDNIFVVFGGKVFQQIVGIPMGTNPGRHIFVLIWSGIHATSHTNTSMTYCKSIAQILRIIWVRCTRWARDQRHEGEQHLCFLLGFPVDREGRSNCAHPFTSNVTFSTSILQTFRSRGAIFHLRQPMAFYLTVHALCQGLLLLWMFYSKGGATFL